MSKRELKIIIKKKVVGTNAKGIPTAMWEVHKSPFALVSNLFGSEFWAANAVTAQTILKFKIRYDATITSDMQIEFRGQTLEIIFVDNIKFENTWLEIKAKLLADG